MDRVRIMKNCTSLTVLRCIGLLLAILMSACSPTPSSVSSDDQGGAETADGGRDSTNGDVGGGEAGGNQGASGNGGGSNDGKAPNVSSTGRLQATFGLSFGGGRGESVETDSAGPLVVERVYNNSGGPPRWLAIIISNEGTSPVSNIATTVHFATLAPAVDQGDSQLGASEGATIAADPAPRADPVEFTIGQLVSDVSTGSGSCSNTGMDLDEATSTCSLDDLAPGGVAQVRVTFASVDTGGRRVDLQIDVTISGTE